jgi:hypothetical protein
MPPPFGSIGTHDPVAAPGHSLSFEQIWYVVHVAEQAEPVYPVTYENDAMPPSPHAGCAACSPMVPVPQHTVPAFDAQSNAPSHAQSVDIATGHAVVAGSHVDAVAALSGGSQQC